MNPEVKTTEATTKQNADNEGSSPQQRPQAGGKGGRKPAEGERKRVLAEWAASGKTMMPKNPRIGLRKSSPVTTAHWMV